MNKRQKEVLQHQLDAEKEILEKLTKQYQRALWDIDVKIRVLQSDELTQSRIYRIEYQKVLKKQVEAVLEKLHADEYTTIQQFLSDTYTDGFVGTAYDMHGQGVPLILPIDRNAAVKAVVTDSKISEGLYESLGVDTKKLKNSISAEITRGIASGLAHSQIAQNIAGAAKAPLGRAKTIVRTEAHRIAQASAMDAQKVAVSKGANVVKQWMSTLDGKTRHSHRRLDGQIREVNEYFEMDGKKAKYPGDFGDPAEDCNCRCQLLQRARIELDEDELKTLQERAKFFELDKTKDFEEFREKYLDASKIATELESTNDWSKTKPHNITKKQRNELRKYADSKGVTIGRITDFDGDPELLKAEIDSIAVIRNEYGITENISVSTSNKMNDADFAQTIGNHITFNTKALRDRRITEFNIANGGMFASVAVEDIATHEMGHVISSQIGNIGLEIAQKTYYNIYGDILSDQEMIDFLEENLSLYSVDFDEEKEKNKMYSPKRYKEIIPEVLAKNSSNGDAFTKEFIELLKNR